MADCVLSLLLLFPPKKKFQLDANETEGRKYRIRPDFKEDPLFRRLTDHNHTAVHIPTDIYDGCEYTSTQRARKMATVTVDKPARCGTAAGCALNEQGMDQQMCTTVSIEYNHNMHYFFKQHLVHERVVQCLIDL